MPVTQRASERVQYLKEERVPDAPDPDEIGERKKRPREVAFMDVDLCFPPSVTLACIQPGTPRVSGYARGPRW
jgi:hypothetical protein